MDEQKEDDPSNDKITFVYSFTLNFAPLNELGVQEFIKGFVTTFNVACFHWGVTLSTNGYCKISCCNGIVRNAACNVSYTFFDNEMRHELYSSPKISAIRLPNGSEGGRCFMVLKTPDEFLKKFRDDYEKGKVGKINVVIELILPSMYFYRPFDIIFDRLEYPDEYPEEMESDFRFKFLEDGDYSITCPNNSSIQCRRSALNLTSKFMQKHFAETKDTELVVEHSIDVVKPIIYYLHSACFEMPKSYNLDFADRLLKAVDFFDPKSKYKSDITESIQKSLCRKLVEEPSNFDSVLRYLSISIQYYFDFLHQMCCALIANKHYDKWIGTFPPNARNSGNSLFCEIFGPNGQSDLENDVSLTYETFDSLLTNVILQ
uniref:Uncharacterized protein n=1 Tax=Panagrolaimus davidi TaxID=227884 RepID=A0A914QT45_9BILA